MFFKACSYLTDFKFITMKAKKRRLIIYILEALIVKFPEHLIP